MALVVLSGCSGGHARDAGVDAGRDAMAIVDGLPEACSGICNAATPSYPEVDQQSGAGDVTMYSTAPSVGGACNYGVTTVMYYAAINVNVQPGDGLGSLKKAQSFHQ
jgi:hypothetical protein